MSARDILKPMWGDADQPFRRWMSLAQLGQRRAAQPGSATSLVLPTLSIRRPAAVDD
jgi:hypothetical protein